jgi:hypothetical protein
MRLKMLKNVVVIALVVMILLCSNAFAALSIQGATVYDDVSKQYWVRDLSLFTNKTYNQQLQTINGMNNSKYNGQSGWHLADVNQLTVLFNTGQIISSFNSIGFSRYGGPIWSDPFKIIGGVSGRYNQSGSASQMHRYAGINYGLYDLWSPYLGQDSIGVISPGINNPLNYQVNSLQDSITDPTLGAWVTTSVPTPIPPAFILMGSGLIGIMGFKQRKRAVNLIK